METPFLWSMEEPMATSNRRHGRRYPPELRERAVRMFQEAVSGSGERYGAITRIVRQLGVAPKSLRKWIMQAEIDGGARVGVTTEDKARIQELERENRELRRANEILKSASAFFARELDPRPPRL